MYKNPETYIEQKLFEESESFKSTIQAVSKRLGFKSNLEVNDITLMYTTCSFETAWNPSELSAWCAVFSEEDFKVLEYHTDIECYWKHGYGFELTFKRACRTVVDIVESFK